MKKLLLPLSILFLACGSDAEKCQYSNMVTTSYNLNKGVTKLISSQDTLKGCFSITKSDKQAELKDSKSNFSIQISTAPNQLIINEGGSQRTWTETRGFKISNEMKGDTLILRYMPTNDTPDVVLKFGTEYKLYN